MKQNLFYEIIPESKLIIEYYSGIIDFNVIVNLSKHLKNDINYNSTYNTIIDIRDAYFIFKNSEIKDFIYFLQSQNLICENRYIAILTNTPNQVAVSTLYEMNMAEHFLNIRIFSTMEAILNWLGLNEQSNILNKMILNFKNYESGL
jgi:hypothetical protein